MITFKTRIKKLEKKQRLARAWKKDIRDHNSEVISEMEEMGWAILLEGSTEWLFLGFEDPPKDFVIGAPVTVTIKVEQ
jgi:hypothetical protein